MKIMRFGLAVVALCTLLAGCPADSPSPATQILVAITSDLMPETELARIEITIGKRDGSSVVSTQKLAIVSESPKSDQATLPVTFAIGKGKQSSFLLVVTGYGPPLGDASGPKIVEQRVIATFQNNKTLLLPVFLGRVCLNQLCESTGGAQQVCYASDAGGVKRGSCGDVPVLGSGELKPVDVHDLPDLTQPPAGVIHADGGVGDAATDASAPGSGGMGGGGTGGKATGGGGTGGDGTSGTGGSGGTSGSGGMGGTNGTGGDGSGGSPAVDPCVTDHGGCDPLVSCSANGNNASCAACPGGYDDVHGDGTKCQDLDECQLQTASCALHSTCSNALGSYDCPCDLGYHGDGHSECLSNVLCDDAIGSNCDGLASCMDVGGGRYCVCGSGYEGDGATCTAINRCATNNGGCGDAAFWTCMNNPGDDPTCIDVNECSTNNGGCGNATFFDCMNNPGAAPGCTDINECDTNNGGCGPVAYWTCHDNTGALPTCGDVDECKTNNGGCGNAMYWDCKNNTGADPTCTDIDECKTNNGGCGSTTYWDCKNNTGAGPTCTDIDECKTNNGGCNTSPMAMCTDNEGAAASCACPAGYNGNGVGAGSCTDKNECSGANVCDPALGPCTNLSGCYTCRGQFADWTPSDSAPIFTDNGDGTVTDPRNGLKWQRDLPATYKGCSGKDQVTGDTCTWTEAKSYCAQLSLGGTGWRLPTKAELESIVDYSRMDSAINPAFGGRVPIYFVTSTPTAWATNTVWVITFDNGATGSTSTSFANSVRCVR